MTEPKHYAWKDGRRKPKNLFTKSVQTTVSQDMHNEIEKYCEGPNGYKKADLIREALYDWLAARRKE